MESIIYVGIDVHKDTYSLCSFDMQKDIFFSQHTMKASTANVASYLKKISESNGNAITVCGYEAGPTGYRLCLDLQQQGFNCVIMAPTSIAKTAKDKILKTDRADAQMLARTPIQARQLGGILQKKLKIKELMPVIFKIKIAL